MFFGQTRTGLPTREKHAILSFAFLTVCSYYHAILSVMSMLDTKNYSLMLLIFVMQLTSAKIGTATLTVPPKVRLRTCLATNL
uniref:Uncharacterized protein n=1 Tax=Glossina palpalis gambiensis TaxID=67801 RepID=A0A1B0B9S3_9MUSC